MLLQNLYLLKERCFSNIGAKIDTSSYDIRKNYSIIRISYELLRPILVIIQSDMCKQRVFFVCVIFSTGYSIQDVFWLVIEPGAI